MTTQTIQPNTCVSNGTMRAVDLADAYLRAADTYGIAVPAGIGLRLAFAAQHSGSTVSPDTSEDTWEALFEMESILDDAAPDGCYFGAIEGDGACIGFWELDPDML